MQIHIHNIKTVGLFDKINPELESKQRVQTSAKTNYAKLDLQQ